MVISEIKTLADLSDFLGIQLEVFEDTCANKDSFIDAAVIPKRRGGYRDVQRVNDDTYRNMLKSIKDAVERHYKFNECVQGFVRGKSTYSNAMLHLAKKVIINADIKSFFDSIPKERVQSIFKDMGFVPIAADTLAELTTVNGVLATGFSTSPVLSNAICLPMDRSFMILAASYNATYSRYADDITLSTNEETVPPKEVIEEVLNQNGFALNADKFKIQRKGRSQYVTGLTVCDTKQPHVPRSIKRSLRLETHYIVKYGPDGHFNYHSLRGTKPRLITQRPVSEALGGWMYYVSGIDKKFMKAMERHLKILVEKKTASQSPKTPL